MALMAPGVESLYREGGRTAATTTQEYQEVVWYRVEWRMRPSESRGVVDSSFFYWGRTLGAKAADK